MASARSSLSAAGGAASWAGWNWLGATPAQPSNRSMVNWTMSFQKVRSMDKVLFRSCKNLDKIYCSNFHPKIRATKYDLTIKLITWMDRKSRDESINPDQFVIRGCLL